MWSLCRDSRVTAGYDHQYTVIHELAEQGLSATKPERDVRNGALKLV